MDRRHILAAAGATLGSWLGQTLPAGAQPAPAMIRLTMSDGASIALEQGGSGPSLLLVHGSGAFHRSWAAVTPLLQSRFHTYAMDRRGHGDSTDGSTYSLAREARDIVEVTGQLPRPVFVLGHSYGAIATLEALRLPNDIQRAAIYEPPIPVTGGVERTSPAPICAALAAGDNEGALLAFFRDYVRLPAPLIEGLRKDPSWADRVRLAPTLCRESTVVETYRFDPRRFANIATPTLVLLGGASPPGMTTSVKAVAAAIPNSLLRLLEGQQHDAMFTAPRLLAQQISDFFLG